MDRSSSEQIDYTQEQSERVFTRPQFNSARHPLSLSAARAKKWACEKALPYWEANAIDREGGFYEDLTHSGKPLTKLVRRLRVQARQIYVYAHASDLGWYDGRDVADNALNFMLEKGYQIDGKPGFIHRLNPDYSVRDDSRDLYDMAFYLLGLAWHGGSHARTVIDDVLAYMDSDMRLQEGFLESTPPVFPRRQNPHMHLFEAMMALFDQTGDREYLSRAASLYDLFTRRIFDPENHVVIEYFDRAFNPLTSGPNDSVEPGHAAEWIWLLRSYQTRTGVDTSIYANALYANLLEQPGDWLIDERRFDGSPARTTRRLWVQTELIKAHLAQAEYGIKGAGKMASTALNGLLAEYLRPDGGWMDQFDGNGQPCAKAMPVSSFYHIFCAIAESVRVAQILEIRHEA